MTRPKPKASVKKPKLRPEIIATDAQVMGHRPFYRMSQVERSLPCYGIKARVGLRVGIPEPIWEFTDEGGIPPVKFYTGTITNVSGADDDPLVTITFDGHPYAISRVCGYKAYAAFWIPLDEADKRLPETLQDFVPRFRPAKKGKK